MWRGPSQYAFSLGLLTGGMLSAAVIVVVGSLIRWIAPPVVWAVVVVLAFVVLAVREVGMISFPMPQNARLVPESVFRHGRFWGPYEFGMEMGTGVRTYVTSGLPYVVILAVGLLAGWGPGLVAGLGFGLGRTVMLLSTLRYGSEADWDIAFDDSAGTIHTVLLSGFALALALVVVAAV